VATIWIRFLLAATIAAAAVFPAHAQTTWTNYTKANGLGSDLLLGVYVTGSTICTASQFFPYSPYFSPGGVSISSDNGATWTNYTTANGLGGTTVNDVYAAGSNIYAATGGGLSVSSNNGASWTTFTMGSGLASNYVNGVYAVGSSIYAATHHSSPGLGIGGGLSISNDNGLTWSTYNTGSGLGSNTVLKVYAAGSSIYAATRTDAFDIGGLSISSDNGATWTNYTTANGLGSNTVNDVYAAGSNIYAATSGGLSVSPDNGASWTTYTTANGLISSYINSVYVSGSMIYAATESGGLSVSADNGESWSTFTSASGLGSNTLYGVYASGSTVYAATFGGGLSVGVVAVPEPSTCVMALAGLACGGYSIWRRRKRA
jgi:hypothetical protein